MFGTPSSLTPLSVTPSSHGANTPLPGLRSAGRVVVWLVIALAIVAGIALFFTYGGDVTPLLHAGH